jgi:hypothetical protein
MAGVVACGCCSGSAAARSLRDVGGCALIGADADLIDRNKVSGSLQSDDERLQNLGRTTGDSEMDVALDRALKRLADTFEVMPGFGFYDDGDHENAWALEREIFPGRSMTVLFGRNFFRRVMRLDPSGISIIQVCAHEFGHIMMYASGMRDVVLENQPTHKRIELHADFMSGYYLGIRKTDHPEASFWRAGQGIWDIGDFAYTSRTHHGTPEERVAAAEAGFRLSFVEHKKARDAFDRGIAYVSTR